MSTRDLIAFFFGCLAVLVFLISFNAGASELECYTDEPKSYMFDLKDQTTGSYKEKVEHISGKLKGVIYKFSIKDVSSPDSFEDYLEKYNSTEPRYSITYALHCKIVKK